ncbi:carboxypeptidase-like regulatory domain-containing protein [Telluribacter sp.]|jgi:hypothetical protein|uniref:carboxypeptidase-like regulatory domain-containing protein n=1 Tax=Telluribacter sp. TaxID=1978767 RepID=UPI002E0F03E4|nr:carboxypeptidase-like regulatory domain-containing protein [Telluribacter sp.]
MRSRWRLYWLCFLVSGTALGQSVQGRVVNDITYAPVAYALVTNSTATTGVYTDTSGLFRWPGAREALVIAAPGYETKQVQTYSPGTLLVVSLVEKPLVLKEIPVPTNRSPAVVQKGAWRKRPRGYVSSCEAHQPREVALFIPNEKQETGILRKVSFYVSSQGKQGAPVRVRVYKNNNGEPGEDLLDENVVTTPRRRWYRWKEVPVGRYNLPVPQEGFFVALEWLHTADSNYENPAGVKCFGQVLGTTDEFTSCRGWYRTNGGSWNQAGCQTGGAGQTTSPMIRVEWLRYR